MTVSNAQKFQGAYNEIEAYIKRTREYDRIRKIIPTILELAKTNRVINEYQNDLIQLVELRNAIVHRSTSKAIAEPYDETVILTEQLRDKILRPKTAKDICVTKVIQYDTETPVKSAVAEMSRLGITSVPVREDGVLVGIISEQVILRWVARLAESKDNEAIIEFTTLDSLRNVLDPIDGNDSDEYKFIPPNRNIVEIQGMFQDAIKRGKRLAAVFVTPSGKPTEPINGVITAWDMHKA